MNLAKRIGCCRPSTAQIERVHSLISIVCGKLRHRLNIDRLYKLVFLKLRVLQEVAEIKFTWKESELHEVDDMNEDANTLFELYNKFEDAEQAQQRNNRQ